MRRQGAFTLIEILIVVVLLGVMAAIVIPSISRSGTCARESALASNLNLLRRFILVYKSHHLEVAPGYPDGNTTAAPTEAAFKAQATLASKPDGETAAVGALGYDRGPYLSKVPANPFNQLDTIEMLANGEDFPAAGDNSHGWAYKAQTGEIRSDSTGADAGGRAYYDY